MPPIFHVIRDLGQVEEAEMLRTFNCGVGMAVVVPAKDVEEVLVRQNQDVAEGTVLVRMDPRDAQAQLDRVVELSRHRYVPAIYRALIYLGLGDKDRAVGIVVNGLQGELVVNGKKYNGIMVPHYFLSDAQVANVLEIVDALMDGYRSRGMWPRNSTRSISPSSPASARR